MNYIPQHLTLADVKLAARQAYDAGLLGAQLDKNILSKMGMGMCQYTYAAQGFPNHHCSVGAALHPRTLDEVVARGANNKGLDDLICRNLITTSDGEAITTLQRIHDLWAASSVRGAHEHAIYHKNRFLVAISHYDAPTHW